MGRAGDGVSRDAEETERSMDSPSVSVVIPTYNRPQLMRRALESVVAQDYDGDVEVLVVFDRSEPDRSLESSAAGRRVRVLANRRTPGLAGNRNTGIDAAQGELVAFCDDDDIWLPGKLAAQVRAFEREPDAEFCTTAMVIDYAGRTSTRLAHANRVTHAELLRSRMAMLHSSSFLIRRRALVEHIGLVDESTPQSMAEDWDLLLRAAERRPILHIDEPLVSITWGATSYFAQQWQVRNESQLWLLSHHPEMAQDPVGAGHSYGKLAFGCAALGQRRDAMRWVGRALRANWREPRAYIALAVVAGLPSSVVMRGLNIRGKGI